MKNILANTVLTLLILNAFSKLEARSGWFWLQPQPTGNQMNAVKFINSMTGYTAGYLGNIMKTTDGGQSWQLLNTGRRTDLQGLETIGSNIVMAVGDSGLILRSTDAGASWTATGFSPGQYYRKIKFPNANTGYVAGNGGRILKSTNAGLSWAVQFSGTGASLFSLDFLDENIEIGRAHV